MEGVPKGPCSANQKKLQRLLRGLREAKELRQEDVAEALDVVVPETLELGLSVVVNDAGQDWAGRILQLRICLLYTSPSPRDRG